MATTPDDLIQYAADVVGSSGTSEAVLRAAISRAYYSAFHELSPFAGRLPRSSVCPAGVKHVNHRELIERLTEWRVNEVHDGLKSLVATKGQLRRLVDAALHSRVQADYKLSSEVSLADAQTQVERVKQILRHSRMIDGVLNPKSDATESGQGVA